MQALAEHVAALNTVCELANLTRGELAAFPVLDAVSVEELTATVEHVTHRLRHEHLAFPNLSWELANALRFLRSNLQEEPTTRLAVMDELRAHLRDVALVLQKQGYSSDVLVALLAAGHAAEDARDARDVLDLS